MFETKEHKSLMSEADDGSDPVNLNLTPMIDVLTCLLFFLLLSFGAIIIALINASVPALSEGTDQAPEEEKIVKVTMSVQISDKGFEVSGDANLSPDDLNRLKKKIDMKAEGYDYQALNEFFAEVKARYKESDTVIILPDANIPYEVLVKVLDSTREKVAEVDGKQGRIPLFQAPVVSSLVK
jgi:biopolymer transport protein ExbD